MFKRDSRYGDTPGFSSSVFNGTRARSITPVPGVIEHTLKKEDRLDRLAAMYYNDPSKWWLILDANPDISFGGEMDMGSNTGTVIVIPADEGRERY